MSASIPPAFSAVSTHLHTASLLSCLALQFPALVNAPSSTLLSTLPLLALAQSAYLLLSTQPSPAPTSKKSRSVRKPVTATTTAAAIIPLLLSLFFSLLIGAPALYLLLVAFGAPVTSHFPETALTAAHFALLIVFPLVFSVGVDGARWREVVALEAAVDEAFLGAVGACVGAWMGAVPIPLDWDREWQKWPVTILAGGYCGYMVGKTVGGVFRGQKMPF